MLFFLLSCIISTSLGDQPLLFNYKTVDGLNIQAGVYVPPIITNDKYPVVLFIHGGGFLVADLFVHSSQVRDEILSRGWALVSIDYRFTPYYFLPDIVDDVIDAYNWIRNDLVNIIPINPDAIAVWGNSAGSGLTVIAGYKLTPRPQAIVALYPFCTDFTTSFAYNPSTPVSAQLIADTNNLRQPKTRTVDAADNDLRFALFRKIQQEQKAGWMLTTSNPDESTNTILDTLREYSVVYHIDANYPPTYLAHGLVDTTVPTSQSIQMADVLNNNNVTYHLDLVPGVGHNFDLSTMSDEFWHQHIIPVFNFVEKEIGKPTPTSSGIPNLAIIIIFAVILLAIVIIGIFFIIRFIKKKKLSSLNRIQELVSDVSP